MASIVLVPCSTMTDDACRRSYSELLTLSLPTLLHPADSIPVMRELKEAGSTTSTQAPAVSLLYRIRRKKSGWIWLESKGRLYGTLALVFSSSGS